MKMETRTPRQAWNHMSNPSMEAGGDLLGNCILRLFFRKKNVFKPIKCTHQENLYHVVLILNGSNVLMYIYQL